MECKDCDKDSHCEYQIDSWIKGEDCPKKWQDKKAEDMTHEQAIEAVKALRKTVAMRITEPTDAEENMVLSGLYTPEEAKQTSKEYKEKMKELTSYENDDWKPDYKEPPLGCKPAQLVCTDRIKTVSDAISRYAENPKFNSQLVKRWATEILLQCEIFERC